MDCKSVLKCSVCDTVIEAIDRCGGEIVCCGREMEVLQEKTNDFGHEMHYPSIEKMPQGINVQVGGTSHPMTERHHIQWIEILWDGGSQRQYFSPGHLPQTTFYVPSIRFTVRVLCSLHGLWKRSQPAYLPEYVSQHSNSYAS